VDAAPQNEFSLAIYSDAGGTPDTLVTNSTVGTLTAD
jgi:hypothetical protein